MSVLLNLIRAEIPTGFYLIPWDRKVVFINTNKSDNRVGFFCIVFYSPWAACIKWNRDPGRFGKPVFKFCGFPVSYSWKILLSCALVANLNVHSTGSNCKGVSSHHCKLIRKGRFYRINSRQDTNKGHYSKCNYTHGKNGSYTIG